MDLLQDYIFISLDIFRSKMHNKKVTTLLEAWMTFFSTDDPEEIIKLITDFPQFKPMYETLYQMCRNVENVMGFFSEELREMDRNTVRYMIDELQKEVDTQKALLEKKDAVIAEKDAIIANLQAKLAEKQCPADCHHIIQVKKESCCRYVPSLPNNSVKELSVTAEFLLF